MPKMPDGDFEKLKEAVFFIASSAPPDELGNVKMHKALYFADMMWYLEAGEPLTGVEYIKQQFGPVARHLTSALRTLELEGKLKVDTVEYFGMWKKSYKPLCEFRSNLLSEREKELLVEVVDFVRGKSAKEISALSHNAAWEAADLGEVLPYFTALQLVPDELDDEDREWAAKTAREIASEPPPLSVPH